MSRRMFTAASMFLSGAVIACGLSFFGPFWLQNLKTTEPAITNKTYLLPSPIPWSGNYSRGLWAQCGSRCQWFWEDGYLLQKNLLTPLKWHLAAQVLYFVGAALVLVSEIVSRLHLCWKEREEIHRSVSGLLFFSFCCQTSAVAVFGGGAWNTYSAKSRPLENYAWENTSDVYFHWCFWMTIPGGVLTITSAILFLLIGCWCRRLK